MRKLTTITLLLFALCGLSAQIYNIELTHSYSCMYGYTTPELVRAGTDVELPYPISALINTNANRVVIKSWIPEDFYITSNLGSKLKRDPFGDLCNNVTYEALDNDGVMCYISLRIYIDTPDINIVVMYSNFTYSYRGVVL